MAFRAAAKLFTYKLKKVGLAVSIPQIHVIPQTHSHIINYLYY